MTTVVLVVLALAAQVSIGFGVLAFAKPGLALLVLSIFFAAAILVDGIGNRSELMQSDGIHPNLQAQPLIAERVWLQLQPMLKPGNQPSGD